MRTGVYVGSFNPPHEGHHKVMKYLLDENLVDQVLLLPTPNYWDKKDLADIKDREEMLRYYEEDKIKVDNVHNYHPYTYQVLQSLRKDYPQDEFYLIIGSDNLGRFHEWKEVEEILKSKVIVLKRKTTEKNPILEPFADQFIYAEDFEFLDISSTEIRNGNEEGLHPKVKEYIKKHHLYEK